MPGVIEQLRYYYGQIDEVVTPYMVKLPVEYQQTLGGEQAEAVFAGDSANHRGTFVFAINDQKAWFDGLRAGGVQPDVAGKSSKN